MASVILFTLLTLALLNIGAQAQDCKDSNKNCKLWDRYCKEETYKTFMNKNCRQTCKLCIEAQAQDCKDSNKNCKLWKEYCKEETYKTFMNKNCRQTCKLCIVDAQQDQCDDSEEYKDNCNKWGTHCKEGSEWYKFMKDNCKKTCGLCPGFCRDNPSEAAKCKTWKNSNYCTKGHKYHDYVKRNCRKTCNFCVEKKTSCGKRGLPSERVIGGVEASPHTWPWSVALLRFDAYFCGGSLINDQWVVTAAHCLYNREDQAEYMDAILGEHDRSNDDGNEKKFAIEKIFNHPDYNGRSLDNDIAVIKLKTKVELKTTTLGTPDKIGTVCLPASGDEVMVDGQQCYITGWGKTKHPGPSSQILMEAKMPIVSDVECKTNNGQVISDKMFCAGNRPGTKQSGCHGDSGGPFVCSKDLNTWTLTGVVSWGSKTCNRADKYTVFARVSKFVDWINKTVKEN